jgi:hypothetical protein
MGDEAVGRDTRGGLNEAALARRDKEDLGGAGPTGAEALGPGAGRGETGSGTPGDTGDLGGGGTDARAGGTASPGGEGRA